MSARATIGHLLAIRRVEFRLAEIPILALPVLLAAPDRAWIRGGDFWLGALAFALLFSFGDMANCLADRDLDATYKPRLSRAVYALGVRVVAAQVAAYAIAALAVAALLAWRLSRWTPVPLVAIGLALGAAYSFPPARLKGRPWAQVPCLWAIIFVGPMLLIGLIAQPSLAPRLVAIASAYATLQMGVILMNTAEDYHEDLAAGIRTTITGFGLVRGMMLASAMAGCGAIALVAALAVAYARDSVAAARWPLLAPLALGAAAAAGAVMRLDLRIRRMPLDDGVVAVKRAARLVPLWLTVVAWTALVAAWPLSPWARP